jgi:PleD family two-component response regulator
MKTVKLLWIDDMENWAVSAQSNLAIIAPKHNIDLQITSASNGENVVQTLMMTPFDGVIMDYHMEPFRGDKYIWDIRREEHLFYVPILFYSQDNSTDLKAKISDLGNVIVVYRPNLEDKIKEVFFK